MKRLLISIVAVLAWIVATSTAVAETHCEVVDPNETHTVQVLECNGNSYLVDGEGKAIYMFVPSGSFHYKVAELWPEYSRKWVTAWSPIIVDDRSDVTAGPNLDADHFAGYPNPRSGGEGTFHVRWGGENTCSVDGVCGPDGDPSKIVHFWGLYTFEDEDPLEDYLETAQDPPGRLEGLWQWITSPGEGAPAPLNVALISDFDPGGGSGNKEIGGP